MSIDQLTPGERLTPELVRGVQAWKDDYPWLHQALEAIGPGARHASDGWRVRIENELKTTLDFKVRPDGTAAVWCGMSAYDFHHYPTPKELFEGLAEAYRRELRVKALPRLAPPEWPKPQSPVRALPPPADDSLTRTVGAVLLLYVVQVMLIFLAMTALTLVLSSAAETVH